MATDNQQDQHTPHHATDQPTLPMGQQGASYSSSYNESTPGETTANREQALHESDADEPVPTEHPDQAGSR